MNNTITIAALRIENFMGIKAYEKTDLKGQNWMIVADNGLGKSTIFKALLWTLNLYMPDDFKPHDQHGAELPDLETSCEFTFLWDGKEVRLKRLAVDIIDKKTQAKKGNDFIYFINDSKTKSTEYNVLLCQKMFNVPQNVLKLLIQPFGFHYLKWQEFRELIIELLPKIKSDIDFLETTTWSHLKQHMALGVGFDTLKTQLAGQIKNLEKDKQKNDVLINDKIQNIRKVEKPQGTDKQAEIAATEQKYLAVMSDSTNNVKIAELIAQKITIESSIREIASVQQQALKKVAWAISDAICEKTQLITNISVLDTAKEKCLEKIRGIQKQWLLENDKKKANLESQVEVTSICSNCNQIIPEEMLTDLLLKANNARAEEIKTISKNLAEIEAIGNKLVNDKKEIETKIADGKIALKQAIDKINQLEEEEKKQKANGVEAQIKQYQAQIAQIDINIAIFQQQQNNNPEVKNLKAKLETLKSEADAFRRATIDYEQYQKALAEIDTLKKAGKKISVELSEKNRILDDAKAASSAKIRSIEQQLNDMFKTVKIKLFDIPMQGDVKETCKVMINGAEFGLGLNTAGMINADLEIKRTFMEHYGACPVFVDCIESVTKPVQLDTQCFYLKVEEGINNLDWRRQ